MKKVIIFIAILAVLFVGLYFLNDYSKQSRIPDDNPYGKTDLSSATIAQLNDPNYQNLILPEELDEKLGAGEDILVYFYSPECEHCKRATPILVPIAEELGANVYQYNLLEFREGWNKYGIEFTPTLVSFKGGEEIIRAVGAPESNSEATEMYEQFLTEHLE